MTNSKKLGIVAAVLLFLVTAGAAVFVVKSFLLPSDNGESAAGPSAGPVVSNPDQIQVGVYLSDYSATGHIGRRRRMDILRRFGRFVRCAIRRFIWFR
jgi:hypothetical protein